jgi:hypothetical protein
VSDTGSPEPLVTRIISLTGSLIDAAIPQSMQDTFSLIDAAIPQSIQDKITLIDAAIPQSRVISLTGRQPGQYKKQ